jgi:Rps23 Pro-64 3,4-dihydroxylase Tpa1-like proline 4-hydroxylase
MNVISLLESFQEKQIKNENTNQNTNEMKEEEIQREDKIVMFQQIRNELTSYQTEFQHTRKVRIPHFFHPIFVERLYQNIIRIPEHHWNVSCGVRNTKYSQKNTPQNKKRNQDNINESNRTFERGEFAYVFHRSMNYIPNEINPFENILRMMLDSHEFKQLLSEITQLDISILNTMFLSRYKTGHFLSPHSDKGNGKLAYVMNMSKGWLPQFGGNLHFLSEDRTSIIETLTPLFNSLVLFYVPQESDIDVGMPHFVGHVAPGVKHSRYAITGWYS